MFANRVHQYISPMKDVMMRVKNMTQENLKLTAIGKVNDASYMSELMTLPSNPTTLRGLSADLSLVDEAAFANKELITHFIMPLLKVFLFSFSFFFLFLIETKNNTNTQIGRRS